MRLSICVFVLLANFGSAEGSYYTRTTQKQKKDNRKMVTEQIAEKGEDNVPYWYILCQKNLDLCLKPVRGVRGAVSDMIFMTKKCDHRFWEWSDCQEKCYRNNLTPGNVWENCVPYRVNGLLMTILWTSILAFIVGLFIAITRI